MTEKTWFKVLIVIFILLIIPVALIAAALSTPSCYVDSYYGELCEMVARLKSAKGKKIVIIGNSNIAFGVHSAYLEEMLNDSGETYTVCNFGLYGAVGTRTMLELSEKYIEKNDIVLFCPEPIAQSMSLYYSPDEMWRCLDADLSMAENLSFKPQLIAAFSGYVAEKVRHSGNSLSSGVYAKNSFDAHCDMTQAERSCNSLPLGYDVNNPVAFESALPDKSFIDYVNSYADKAAKKGASMYFTFCPVNKLSVPDEKQMEEYYDALSESFNIEILGNPYTYLMDAEWFYDNNFHLNDSGMLVRTVNLYNDLMVSLFNKQPRIYDLPEKPELPPVQQTGQGDNTDENKFTYQFDAERNGYIISGVTEQGKTAEALTIPFTHRDFPVIGYEPTAFHGLKNVTAFIVQENIPMLYNNSFNGCERLRKIIVRQIDPNKIGVGYNVLEGLDDCRFYVNEKCYARYCGHYTWGHLIDYIDSYREE